MYKQTHKDSFKSLYFKIAFEILIHKLQMQRISHALECNDLITICFFNHYIFHLTFPSSGSMVEM